ncbi:MAG: AMP-binding protein [Actinomycetota bacterium]|nr:AMP-binding protein [Actinomycetota bacterium]
MTTTEPLALSSATGPVEPPLRDLTISALLREVATEHPDRIALVAGVPDPEARRQWTYAELLAEAERAARALRVRFEPGERVAVWAPNVPQWVVLEFACAVANIVLVTVNPAFQARELQYVLTQSGSAGLILLPEFRGNPMLGTATDVRPECPNLREVIRLDEWDEFLDSGDAFDGDLEDPDPMDSAMIQYTSGTTGFPKGALLHHRGLVNNGHQTGIRVGASEGSVYVLAMPLFHTGGCVLGVLTAVSMKMTMVLVEAFDPGLVLELIETYRGTAMLGVPTMLVAMLEHPDFAIRDLSSVEAICSGGSTVPAALVQRLENELKAPFTIVFGQTELSPVSSMTHTTDSITDKAQTIGTPMPHVEVKIIDPETGETVPPGTVGEYCARGYLVMHGYYEMPDATAETIDSDGWLHTGDLAAMDDRGYLTIEGRLKDMIIRGGENIYPKEVEELLFAHETVGEVAVVGLPDDKWGEVVSALVRPAPGQAIDRNELFAYLREHLAPHKTPKHWFLVDEWPLTGSGKIQKYVLRDQWVDGLWVEMA